MVQSIHGISSDFSLIITFCKTPTFIPYLLVAASSLPSALAAALSRNLSFLACLVSGLYLSSSLYSWVARKGHNKDPMTNIISYVINSITLTMLPMLSLIDRVTIAA